MRRIELFRKERSKGQFLEGEGDVCLISSSRPGDNLDEKKESSRSKAQVDRED